MTGIEMLREYAARETSGASCNRLVEELGKTCDDFAECSSCRRFVHEAIADQIERETLPRPRFEDGEPVQFGDEFVSWNGKTGTVRAIDVVENGRLIIINTSSSNNYVVGEKDSHGQFAKRPEPPDTWERLTAEVEACDGSACQYYNKDHDPKHHSCEGCRVAESAGDCLVLAMRDILRRAKKLAEVE